MLPWFRRRLNGLRRPLGIETQLKLSLQHTWQLG